VTVKAGAVNQAPVAVGTIPGSSLGIGGSSTIDAAGYFSDADGDELSYTGSSSNEGVATVAMEGSSATITAVGAGDAVITITASDGSASVSQGFTVTVEAAPVNNPPQAVGTIPGSTLQIGQSSSPLDVSGYFSDADGDELTYTGSSSNEAVATVSMEGSMATIAAVAAGDAVITITASDGEAAVSQGFSVTVPAGPKAATVTIFGVQDLSGGPVDPTNVHGKVNVLVNYEPNDETVVGIELMIGDYAMHCLGQTGSGESDLAGSGSQVEARCLFETAKVMGECSGAQLSPMFANGAVELGARIHTQGGETRDALATQTVMLNNSNYVMVSHSPGSGHILKDGMPLYGGSSETEGNMNSFSACPVAFDGTTVGKMSLRALNTGPAKADPHTAATSLSFTAPTTMPANTFNGMAADRESADGFTWDVNSAWNGMVEDEGPGGREHWVFAGEKLENADGVDVSADFGIENPFGPFYFDFKAPRPGTIQVNKADPDGEHYSAHKDNAIALSSVEDMGAGVDEASIMIAVGDGSAAANKYNATTKMPDRTMTPFDAVYPNVSHISDLAEEDADCTGKDDNGLGCYVAELTSLADKLGNAWSGGKTPGSWLQTKAFGVDNTAARLSDIEPDDQGLVFNAKPHMSFEVDNPDLASDDDGTDLTYAVEWKVGTAYVAGGTHMQEGRDVTVTLDDAVTADNGAKSVRVTVSDGATPPNKASYALDFAFDTKVPTYSISRTQGDISRTGASSVTVSVEGTISDANNIANATLRLLLDSDEDGMCYAGDLDAIPAADTLATGRLDRRGYKRNLADGTSKSVSLNSTFTINAPNTNEAGAGPENYCFRLDVEDVSVEAHGRGDGNDETYADVGGFNVAWPAGPAPPPPGPTFEFTTRTDDTDATTATPLTEALDVVEGTNTVTYWVSLSDHAPPPTATDSILVTIDAQSGVSVSPAMIDFWNGTAGAAIDAVQVTVTATEDRDVGNEENLTVTHSATGFDDATLMVTSMDDDAMLEVRESSITEDGVGDTKTFYVVATLTNARAVDAADATANDVTLPVTFGGGSAVLDTDYTATTGSIVISSGDVSDSVEVTLAGLDNADIEGDKTFMAQATPGSNATDPSHVVPAMMTLTDDDPNVTLTVTPSSLNEGDGPTTLTISAESTMPMPGTWDVVVTIPIGAGYTANGEDATGTAPTVTLTIDTGDTESNSRTVVIDPLEDDDSNNITFEISGPAAGQQIVGDTGKTFSIKSAMVKITDNDS
jgi:hypothetical protein